MERNLIDFPAQIPFIAVLIALVTSLYFSNTLATDEPIAIERNIEQKVEEKIEQKDFQNKNQKDAQLAILYETLANAPTQLEGQLAENAIWQHWFDQSPTAQARSLLDSAIERREAYDFEAAEEFLDKLIEAEPGYAEGYNQRAFIRFLRENYDESKADLEIALAKEPNHFAALAGLYQVYSRIGEQDKALANLEKAVSLHPWLKERGALPKAMWPKRYREIHEPGQDI